MSLPLYLLQVFIHDEKWETIGVSIDLEYATEDYDIFVSMFTLPLRLVEVRHPSLDFLAQDARDFKVLESRL